MLETLNKYKWFILSGTVLLVVISIVIFFNFPQKNLSNINPLEDVYPTPFPVKSKNTSKVSPLQKTEIGKTTVGEVEKMPDLLSKEQQADGSTVYSFKSELLPRPEKIITKDDKVVFESMLTPESPRATGFVTSNEFKHKYGEPESIIKGSKFYGWFMESWVYASKGFTLIVNPNTNEVFEIQTYQPMSKDTYVRYFGEDITLSITPPME